jgi:DNA-binding NarL/FixJ family response regulator
MLRPSLKRMNIDQIQDNPSAFSAHNDKKRGGQRQSQVSGHEDYRRYENLLRRVEEVFTELVNLRREHNQFVISLTNGLLRVLEARRRTVELSERERQVREMRRAGRAEKQIAAELGVGISTVKSYQHRVKIKEQLQRDRKKQARKIIL